MTKRRRIAATKVFLVTLAVFLVSGALAGWKPALEVIQRHHQITSFTGSAWTDPKNQIWRTIENRLIQLRDAAFNVGSRTQLVPAVSFGFSHTNYKPWQGNRYETTSKKDSGQVNYNVNYGFAVMTHPLDKGPSTTEYEMDREIMELVMWQAIDWYQSRFKNQKGPGLYTEDLARVVLSLNDDELQGIGVNSIYIASEGGLAAFYPANSELAPKRKGANGSGSGSEEDAEQVLDEDSYYDARTRPWFKAALAGTNTETTDGRSGLTYEYLDYSDKVNLVRTAWRAFQVRDRTYIVCIDLMLYGDSTETGGVVEQVSKELGNLTKDAANRAASVGAMAASPFGLMAVLLLFGAFPTITNRLAVGPRVPGKVTYRFRRMEGPLYWRPEGHGTEEVKRRVTNRQTAGQTLEVDAGVRAAFWGLLASLNRKLWTSTESTTEAERVIMETIPRGPKDVTERCVERWSLEEVRSIDRECQGCGYHATIGVKTQLLADMRVVHRDHDQVEVASLTSFPEEGGLVTEALARAQLAEHVAVGGEASAIFDLKPSLVNMPAIPQHIAQLVNVSSHLEVARQVKEGRLGYDSGVEISLGLYGDSAIEAVADTWYLERLIRSKKTEMLYRGSHIRRVLFGTAETDIYELYQSYPDEFIRIVQTANRQLGYVTKSDLPEVFETFNKWDFGVLNHDTDRACAIVSDTADAYRHRQNKDSDDFEGIRGELSWRRADIEFYHQIFEQMWAKKRDLLELIEKWKQGEVPVRGA